MKYAVVALLATHTAATTVFPCPYTMSGSLEASFAIDADTSNCKGNSIVKNDFGNFLDSFAGSISGATKKLGVFELDTDRCPDNGRKNLRRRNLQWNFYYNYAATCTFCPPFDDDFRRLVDGGVELDELEGAVSLGLTDLASEFFTENKESCLFGQEVAVTVTLTEATDDCSN